MDKFIRGTIELFSKSKTTIEMEIEIENERIKLRLKKDFIPEKLLSSLSTSTPRSNVHIQTSKGVGFFKSQVETEEKIKINQCLGTIKTVGIENKIESETTGIVRKIFIKDNQAVEYGEPLFVIQPLS